MAFHRYCSGLYWITFNHIFGIFSLDTVLYKLDTSDGNKRQYNPHKHLSNNVFNQDRKAAKRINRKRATPKTDFTAHREYDCNECIFLCSDLHDG